jgi:hypothetical protein
MVRNLNNINSRPFLPTLVCRNKTGDPSQAHIINAITTSKGDNKNRPVAEKKMSKILLIIFYGFLLFFLRQDLIDFLSFERN